jgi:enoyl-CoA hydratase/3-hydroxyacyl-CoA dehydrogenase
MPGDYENICVERPASRVGSIVLDRPEANNRISPQMLEEFDTAITELAGANDVRVVYLTSAGEGPFTQGADLSEFQFEQKSTHETTEISRRGHEVFSRLRDIDEPVIAGLDGDCFGGGMEMSTYVDLRVASEDANFSLPEQSVGLIPGWGGTAQLQEIIGQSAAKYIVFTARVFPAEKLYELGFLHEVHPDEEFDDRAMAFAEEIASNAPLAQRYSKRVMHDTDNFDAGHDAESIALGHVVDSTDFKKGLDSLGKQRKPEFRGE